MMTLKLRYNALTETFVPLAPINLAHDTIVEVVTEPLHNGSVSDWLNLSLEETVARIKASNHDIPVARHGTGNLKEILATLIEQDRDVEFDLEEWQKAWDMIEAEIEAVHDYIPHELL